MVRRKKATESYLNNFKSTGTLGFVLVDKEGIPNHTGKINFTLSHLFQSNIQKVKGEYFVMQVFIDKPPVIIGEYFEVRDKHETKKELKKVS